MRARSLLNRTFTLFLMTSGILLLFNIATFAKEPDEDEEDFVPGEIIVKFKTIGPRLVPAASPPQGFKIVESTSSGALKLKIDPENPDAHQGETRLKERTLEEINTLRKKGYVEYAHPNYRVRPQASSINQPDDPRYKDQWAFHNNEESPGGIGLPRIWNLTQGNSEIVVAILDTGITKENEDIEPSTFLRGYDFVSSPQDAMDGDGRDGDPNDVEFSDGCIKDTPLLKWHGTQVASLIGAVRSNNQKGMAGINWNIKIQPIRVMGPCSGSITDVADAIRWAAGISVDGVPDNKSPARIINLSMEGAARCSKLPELQSAIDEARNMGAIIVASAGNTPKDVSRIYPGGCTGIVAVAASDRDGRLASYSGYGPGVTIMAPGGDFIGASQSTGILTAIKQDFVYNKGTSFSAPIVSGVLALWLSTKPATSNEDLIDLLKRSSFKRNSQQCPSLCGAGLLNAYPFQ